MISKLKELLGFGPAPNYKELLEQGGLVVDVRSKAEYATGHIKGSKNIPLPDLNNSTQLFKDKSRPIIACCASGMRSASAKSLLKSKGYTNVHNGGSWGSLNSKINS